MSLWTPCVTITLHLPFPACHLGSPFIRPVQPASSILLALVPQVGLYFEEVIPGLCWSGNSLASPSSFHSPLSVKAASIRACHPPSCPGVLPLCDIGNLAGEEDVVDLPFGSLHWFSDIEEVANLPDNAHCRPRSKIYTSIDFVRQPD